MPPSPLANWHGALLIDKPAGVSSFGVIERLQRSLEGYGLRRRELPKLGHGGTLDPFATGLLAVCVGDGVKLARYFLGSRKRYEALARFGETTVSGDHTGEISATTAVRPTSLDQLRAAAHAMARAPYLQTPPMHSAKKQGGRPLYELARQGLEVERAPKSLTLHAFDVLDYDGARARFRVDCSSGTYVRTLAQDLAANLGTLALLEELRRTGFGPYSLEQAMPLDEIERATREGRAWPELPAWVPFNALMGGYERVNASRDEALALIQGKQAVLPSLMARLRAPDGTTHAAIYHGEALLAVACQAESGWGLERVLTVDLS